MGETLRFEKQNKLVVEESNKLENGVEQWVTCNKCLHWSPKHKMEIS